MTSHELLEMLHSQPSSGATSDASGYAEETETPGSAYKLFFQALEELEDNRTLYGPASVEAGIARARVKRLREVATDTWRRRQAA